MKKSLLTVTNVVAAAGVLFAGYVLFAAFPDLPHYIRISTM